jgi:hypothetical protein
LIFCQEEEERAELYNRVAKEVEEHALDRCAARWVCCTLDVKYDVFVLFSI